MAEDHVKGYRMVAIGGSAGSLEIVLKIIAGLPVQTTASFMIVMHRRSAADAILTGLLSLRTRLPVREVEDKEAILPGTIYIAPPDYHLLLENARAFSLDASEKVQYSRPSIDVAFESAAATYGRALIGILLSGANADGAAGLKAIADHGGYTIVQQPATAEMGYMPLQAMNATRVDAVLEGDRIGDYLRRMLT